MTYEEVCSLLETPEFREQYGKHPQSHWASGLWLGLEIIARHEPESSYSFTHEDAYFAFSEETSRDEIMTLNRLGFRLDEDGWALFS